MSSSLAGKCLLASPFLESTIFCKSIVLILRHSAHQTFGLILNRPTEVPLADVVSRVCELKCVHDGPLLNGGPVDGLLVAIHDHDATGGQTCARGLYVTNDQEDLKKLFVTPEANIKLFEGLSRWSAGQLESEIQCGYWFVSAISPSEIMSNEDLWGAMVKRYGDSILGIDAEYSGKSNQGSPFDPRRN